VAHCAACPMALRARLDEHEIIAHALLERDAERAANDGP